MVKNRKGKHTSQFPQSVSDTPTIEGSGYYFGIGACPESVTGERQFAAQFVVVVDLAVEYDFIASISRGHRLSAAADINDSQATVSKPQAGPYPNAFSVRTSVRQGGIHAI